MNIQHKSAFPILSKDSRGGRPTASGTIVSSPILGVAVACVDMAGMIDELGGWLDRRGIDDEGIYVCFRDVHGVVLAQDDAELMEAHHRAYLVVADGKPLSVLGRARGNRGMDQVRGIDSVPALCSAGLNKGWRHFFIGGAPGVADQLAQNLTRRFPGLVVAGTECPPFRPLSIEETDAVVARINAASPDLVWVGLGSPKQELWMARVAPRLKGAICMGVGAAFDVHTERVRTAPEWVRRAGVEWAFRIIQEPRRLTGRYLRAIPRFLALIALEAIGRRTGAR
jgi:N-acetylglucosaminyldiphosphoundecaprenol N-acetyl-beta-D-mannosaminyltransferase